MTESYTDGATDPATDQVTYGDVEMIRNMCDRWKDCGIKHHEGVILMEFKVGSGSERGEREGDVQMMLSERTQTKFML